MTTHDPLTPTQIALVDRIANAPIRMTIAEQSHSPEGRDVSYLSQCGYITPRQVHISQVDDQHVWEFTCTSKPLV